MSNANYYKKYKDKIKAKRKKLYDSDPEFREIHKARVKAYKKKKYAEMKLVKERLKIERKVWRNLSVGGQITPCCKIGYLSASINRTTQTVRLWETEGLLPKTITLNDIRYYTKKHYQLIVRLFNQYEKNLPKFFSEVRNQWNSKI